jgi:hypothetical protein|tara:strand:+ start:1129 stop:2037 length:909 start_codon:yes stop_codon:yes gene_type:complete
MGEPAEEPQFELDVGDAEETEVELEQPEETPEPEEPAVEVEQETSSDDEIAEYSESVQKRINRLTKKMREAERREEEAIKYAQNVQAESEQIRKRMQNLDQGFMAEHGQRIELEQAQAEAALKRAVELGDPEATVEAQKQLTQISIAANNYAQAQRQSQANQELMPQQQAPQAAPQQQAPQQPQRPDPKAEQWAEKNSWFGQDEAMTFAAFGIHKKLVEEEGFDPQGDDYYNELDSRIKREFPHKFGEEQSTGRKPAQNVAGVSRSTKTGRSGKRVKLSQTQVAIAKKLGVPLEEYAKYVKE